ncbi:MAG TPA: protease inhibitor I42 family protein [Dehalococcoidia bacterium]|nr:protease inhibitor I42 family protein [Dehalococcoidia bacterium]
MAQLLMRASGATIAAALLLLATQGVRAHRLALAQTVEPSCAAQSDPNTPITVSADDEFAIGLPSNKTTGYSWQLDAAPDPGVAYWLASVYVLPAPPAAGAPIVGAGGRECWIFYATGPGQTTLTLDYLRPFDPPGTPPAQSATFTVIVQ